MLLSEFDYQLPPELIASRPLAQRDASRLMLLRRAGQAMEDRSFANLPQILEPGDLVVFNNTRVFPARLLGKRRGERAQPLSRRNPAARQFLAGEVELLLTRNEGDGIWLGLVHPGRKIGVGETLVFGGGALTAEVLERGAQGLRRVRLTAAEGSIEQQIERLGHIPLPPYIGRGDDASDRDAYQTVYAKVPGAVAAPTAGLHFSTEVIEALHHQGVETCEITLHVGLGTFRPVKTAHIEDHAMEPERYEISQDSADLINRALSEGRHVIAVGTTSVRTLEHAAGVNCGQIKSGGGETNLYITPGFRFRVIGGLLTNFHLPRSTLLMLVSAFSGREFTLRAYQHAIEERYRFYSYGDCMLIL